MKNKYRMNPYLTVKQLILVFLSWGATFTNVEAQQKPDSNSVFYVGIKVLKDLSKTPTSVLYYPRLMKRFIGYDSTLNGVELAGLLIGFTQTKAFANYKDYKDSLYMILDEISNEEYVKAKIVGDKLIKSYPIYLNLLMVMYQVDTKLNNLAEAKIYRSKLNQIIEGMENSGEGTIDIPIIQIDNGDDETFLLSKKYSVIKNDKLVDFMDDINDPIKINLVEYADTNGQNGKIYFFVSDIFTRNFVYDLRK